MFGQGKPRMEREPALDAKKQMAIFLSNESGSIDVIVTQLYYTQTQMLSLTHSLTRSLTHSLAHSLRHTHIHDREKTTATHKQPVSTRSGFTTANATEAGEETGRRATT